MLPRLPAAPAGSKTETLKYFKSSAMKLVQLQLQITDKDAHVENCLSCWISLRDCSENERSWASSSVERFIVENPPLARRLTFISSLMKGLIEVDLTAAINKAAWTHLSVCFAPRANISYVLYSQHMAEHPHQCCPHWFVALCQVPPPLKGGLPHWRRLKIPQPSYSLQWRLKLSIQININKTLLGGGWRRRRWRRWWCGGVVTVQR